VFMVLALLIQIVEARASVVRSRKVVGSIPDEVIGCFN
jgi:hypothetical protein